MSAAAARLLSASSLAPSRASSPASLRALLSERFPTAIVHPQRNLAVVSSGLSQLDIILPHGGFPRGRVAVWQPGGGGTAVLRSAVAQSLQRGERVAWVDGARSIGPQWTSGPLVIRPNTSELARKAAEILLRSGGFALVVLTGLDLDSAAMLRLSRMVHEGGGAFVALTTAHHTAMLRLSSHFLPDQLRASTNPFGEIAKIERVTIRIESRSPGWNAHTLLHLPARHHDLRLPFEPSLADRRGDLG